MILTQIDSFSDLWDSEKIQELQTNFQKILEGFDMDEYVALTKQEAAELGRKHAQGNTYVDLAYREAFYDTSLENEKDQETRAKKIVPRKSARKK